MGERTRTGLRCELQRRLIRHAWVPVLKPNAQILIEDLGTRLFLLAMDIAAIHSPCHRFLRSRQARFHSRGQLSMNIECSGPRSRSTRPATRCT